MAFTDIHLGIFDPSFKCVNDLRSTDIFGRLDLRLNVLMTRVSPSEPALLPLCFASAFLFQNWQ
jgi:hypothetical protein